MKALVAMSGGVDSSVTAALMAEEGYDCTGVNMRLYSAPETALTDRSCCSIRDAQDARSVADGMGMPFFVLYYTEEFRRCVIDPFVSSYLSGITPIRACAVQRRIRTVRAVKSKGQKP